MISILILTLNEEINISECIASISFSDDIVVLDSFSSDKTISIAQEKEVKIIQHKFDNWAGHQNWAMENIEFKNDWVFYIDADERMTPELADELLKISEAKDIKEVAYYCGRKNFFMEKWLKYSMPPGHIMRFFKPAFIRFERLVNPTPVINGKSGYLKNYLLHYNFSKGLTEWLDKHNKYSLMEAMEGVKNLDSNYSIKSFFIAKDPYTRRKELKKLSFRLPFRPLLKFIYLYVLKLGFLDGKPGYIYCRLQSLYEYMIVIKMKELKREQKS